MPYEDEEHRARGVAPAEPSGDAMSVPVEHGGDAMSVSPAGQMEEISVDFEAEVEQLFRENFRKLVAIAMSLGGITLEEAEDAVDTAFEEAYQKWPTLTNPGAWVCKATISNVLKIKRTQVREAQAKRKAQPGSPQPEVHEDPRLMEVVFRQWVMSILDFLPPAQREAVALCLVDGFSPAEAAELLGKNSAALRQALHAGLKSLRRYLADETATKPAPRAGASTTPASTAGRKEVR